MSTYIPKLSGVTLEGDEFPSLGAFAAPVLPYAEDLLALHTFGLSLEASAANYVAGHPPLAIVGDPAVAMLGASLNRSNCFKSDFVPRDGYTMVLVAKPKKVATSSQNWAFLMSNLTDIGAGVGSGDSFIFADTGAGPSVLNLVQAAVGGATGTRGTMNISALDESKWHAFFSVLGPGGTSEIQRSNVGVGREGTFTWGTEATGVRTPTQNVPMFVGGFDVWAGAVQGSVNSVQFQLAAVYGRRLTNAQCVEVYQSLHDVWGPLAGLDGL